MKKTSVILVGAPCSGKTTTSHLILERYSNATYFSIGDILRRIAKENTLRGKKILEYFKTGIGLSDEFVIKICKEEMPTDKELLIVDGSVKSINQITNISSLENINVLFLDVEREELLKRAKSRAICPLCNISYVKSKANICVKCNVDLIVREDDKNITYRINKFYKNILPAINELRKSYPNRFHTFNNQEKSNKDLFELLKKIIK